jgi:hypothetical protein
MSLVKVSGNASGTGTLTIAAPNTNSDRTLTLPDVTATLGINGPAFFVRPSAGQTVTLATATKIQLNTEEFDTNSNYDTTTYRFTPTVAGYYQISAGLRGTGASTNTQTVLSIYKNGSAYISQVVSESNLAKFPTLSALVSMNGSTDYIEFYGSITGSGTATFGTTNADGSYVTWASGCLVRGA